MPSQPTNSGIITDEQSGERHIPESTRADGSVRKAIKVRPGYRPPEDVELYKNRTAETFRNRYKGGVIGAETTDENSTSSSATASNNPSSAAANKNAKRREARKKAKAEAGQQQQEEEDGNDNDPAPSSKSTTATPQEPADPDAEREKKARNLKKKLKQAKDLKDKKEGGQTLLPEQIAKVIKINELVRELAALGFDSDGEPVKKGSEGVTEDATKEGNGEEAPA